MLKKRQHEDVATRSSGNLLLSHFESFRNKDSNGGFSIDI